MSSSEPSAVWAASLRHLAAARFYLPQQLPCAADSLLSDADEYLHHNELGLALHTLIDLGEACGAPADYWQELLMAADHMGLQESRDEILAKLSRFIEPESDSQRSSIQAAGVQGRVMNPKDELYVLEEILKMLDRTDAKQKSGPGWVATVALCVGVATVFYLAFRYGGAMVSSPFVLAGVCFLTGFGLAYGIYKTLIGVQWPVMAKYIDRAQIEARIAELRT